MIEHKKSSFWAEYRTEVITAVIGLLAVNAIFIPKAFRQSTTVNPEAAGQLGSFVGGYVGPIFSLLGILLLFSTLRHQRLSFEKQSFVSKYFELLKMHRENVGEIGLKSSSGRKFFVLLTREFRCALEIVREIASENDARLSPRQLIHIAYNCLFFGVGPNSSRMLKMSLSSFDHSLIEAIERKLNSEKTKDAVMARRKFEYVPFEGHQSRLGHYYRHLYQLMRYIDGQPPELKIDKYEFGKTVRAQLSTHEQAMLLLNSLTPIGGDWWSKRLIIKYRMVQNIPKDFFDRDTEIDVDKLFEPGYFEWEDVIQQRVFDHLDD